MGVFVDKLKEVLMSIMPIILIVGLLAAFVLKLPNEELAMMVLCIALVVLGFTIFLSGVEIGIDPMGGSIGKEIPKRRSKFFMIAVVFTISFLVTIAEPDVTVFATQVNSLFSSINPNTLTYCIAIGVALFLIVAACRIVYKLSLRAIITIGYAVVAILTLILYFGGSNEFIAIAFDSGGVTTGPVTVPVLLALGIGICSVGAKRNKMEGFGMIGLASIGPIIALLIMGLVSNTDSVSGVTSSVSASVINGDLLLDEFIESTKSVLIALIPLIIFFIIFQKIFLGYSWNAVTNMIEGVAFAGVGVIIFLTGVYTGFMPIAVALGEEFSNYDPFLVIGIGFLLGFLVAFAEPAVAILGDQVERTSGGVLSRKLIIVVISIGVAFLVALGMAKTVFNLNFIWIIIPGYVLTIVLMWYGEKDMVGIAFDAGGVSTGPMSVAILSSIYVGLSSTMYTGTEAVINGFGLIALIALAPCLFLSALSVYIKNRKKVA
ncbi:MAG: DUF1538 domain-containing protein [Candidatus Methanomethylophilaceae archaeon]|nr:DUF1538 domain-containing protein [Candidatus Methanomethylophilaceae archaeon]